MISHTISLADGSAVPALGQGTWHLGETPSKYQQEIKALQAGIDVGMCLIDTAEMYGSGLSETIVGNAIQGITRDRLFLVSKVLPSNAGKRRIVKSCEQSLHRLGIDYLDLYLLHWCGNIPLEETVFCLEELKKAGKIKNWGVSNFDIDDMKELWQIPNGTNCLVNQVLYHMGSRGIEFSLLPWMRDHHVALMAYCPLAQAGTLHVTLMDNPVIRTIAQKHHATPEQILLAWCIRDRNTIAIPRSGNSNHTLINAMADQILLDQTDLDQIDTQFSPPTRKEYLDIQ